MTPTTEGPAHAAPGPRELLGWWASWWSWRPPLRYRNETPMSGTGTGTHRCPAIQCGASVRDELLMCGPHWRMVPPSLQRAVYGAYERGRGVGTMALFRAQTDAIRAVDRALGFPSAVD
jgi:hypothetical protein